MNYLIYLFIDYQILLPLQKKKSRNRIKKFFSFYPNKVFIIHKIISKKK